MVLKWYLNSKTIPIYQWIPPSHPQGLGKFKGFIDLDFEISRDPYTRHRALFILNPTVEMSGEYTCKISTVENEVSLTSRMTVYAQPRKVTIWNDQMHNGQIKISCLVDHVFPRPRINISKDAGEHKFKVKNTEEEVKKFPDGAWRVLQYVVLNNSFLDIENLFTCDISIPGTNYKISRKLLYSPGLFDIV